MSPQPGARFCAVDLHIHSPASHDYVDKHATPADFVSALTTAKLDIIAVTDHNSAEWVDLVRAAAKKEPVVVFPGIEITTPHCHVLAIFDPATPKSTLDDLLTTVGIKTADRGKKEALAKQPEDVLRAIREAGGIAVAAHANSSNGLLKHPKGQYKLQLYHRSDLAALEFAKKEDVENFRLGLIPQYAAKACVQGSDAHSLAEIGSRRTFLKMDSVSLWGLAQALADQPIRVRYEWNEPVTRHPHILTLAVNQGFFGGARFEFHPSLNCLVGGRGTGKSTAIELLRFSFEDTSPLDDIAEEQQSKVAALLGHGGKISVRYLDSDGMLKLVEREFQPWETERTVRTEDGSDAELLSPPAFFSQGELTRIASERTAQLELIDRYVGLEEEHARERRLLADLKANAAQLDRLTSQNDTVDQEVGDKDTGLTATRQKYRDLEKTLQNPVLKDFPAWESENRYLEAAGEALGQIEQEFNEAIDGIEIKDAVSTPDAKGPSHNTLKKVPAIFSYLARDVSALKNQFADAVQRRRKQLDAVRRAWTPAFQAKQRAYEAVLDKAGTDDTRKGQAQLRQLKKRLDDLERKSKGQTAAQKQVTQLTEKRRELLDALNQTRKSRFDKRSRKAAEWEAAFGGKIQVAIAEGGDKSAYVGTLRSLSKGAMLRDPDLEAIAVNVSPSNLCRLVQAGNSGRLAAVSGVKPENAKKLIDAIGARSVAECLEIASVRIDDVPSIRYESVPGRVKTLNQLSVGQKATVIISLALIEGEAPLVIDQPEEPLDTLAITNPVVDTLRGQKDVRQFIFTTHNPNVAVGGDAELNIVLEAGADRGEIKASGGVDEPTTNELLILHLEGGPDALKRRFGKYRSL